MTINKDGMIYYENIGFINLSNKTLASAEVLLTEELSRIYSTLKDEANPTNLMLELGKLKSINIYFSGHIENPGINLVHPFSDIFSSIVQAGGVNDKGSLREVQLIRNGQIISTNKNFENIGLDIEKINKSKININLYQESFEGEETTKMDGIIKIAFGMILGMLLYIFIFAYGSMIMMSVIEEKTSRIVEIMISSVKPFQLMMGKILGTSLAGLTQFLVWTILIMMFSYLITAIFGIETSTQNSELLLSSSGNMSMNTEALDAISAFINLPLTNIIVAFLIYFIGGYLLYASLTHEMIFDYQKDDRYWCTADIGWITGHSYIIYGPLANGATTIMFEGVPNYPDNSRWWQIVDKYKVNTFYTAPTAIRALMREGDKPVKKTSRKSLKLLGTVGEPINPEAWMWYYKTVGNSKCPIVDTWWQTETGGILISPQTGAINLKPGSATKPFFGIVPIILNPATGQELSETSAEGILCIKDSWPGQMRTIYGDHQRFMNTYFSDYKGYYFTGDGCRRDEDGYYWITGRVDDVLNVSGHRMGTAEIESSIVAHPKVAESAVVGYPHPIKGQGIYAFVTLMSTEEPTEELKKDLENWVRKEIGPIAKPDIIQWAPGLPKTRSGKIMRRVLRKIAENDFDSLGDISTLADPTVVEDLIKNKEH